MARKVPFNKIGKFSPPSAASRQAIELALFEQNIATKLRQDDLLEYGPFSLTSVQNSTYTARPWEIVRVDPSLGAFGLTLPDPTRADCINSWIGVKNVTDSSAAVTIAAISSTIDGAATQSVRGPRQFQWFFSTGAEWVRGPTLVSAIQPLRVLDNAYSPVANWSFNIAPSSTVPDLSGNAITLSTETGTLRTTTIHPSLGGCYFDGATNLYNATPQTKLQILSDLTILVLGLWADIPGAGAFSTLYSYGAPGETSDTNCLYLGQFDSSSQFAYFSEHGAGVNDPANTLSTAGRFQPFLLGLTRDSGGVLKHWLNGIFAGSPFGTITLPTDGHNGLIRIGCDQGGGNFFKGILASVAIYNKVLTTAQMLERYNYTMGGAFGYK